MSVFVINFCLIFLAVVTIAFSMPDVQAALDDPSYYPTIYVLRETMSTTWLTVVLVMITALLICSNVAYLTATARDLFAFSRDNGVPLSNWVAKVRQLLGRAATSELRVSRTCSTNE